MCAVQSSLQSCNDLFVSNFSRLNGDVQRKETDCRFLWTMLMSQSESVNIAKLIWHTVLNCYTIVQRWIKYNPGVLLDWSCAMICPFRRCAHGWEGLCCALHVTEALCSRVRRRPPCAGMAGRRLQSAGGHGRGSSDFLQPHLGPHGSVELQPLRWFPHVRWQARPLRRSQPSPRGETAPLRLVLWADLSITYCYIL